MKSLCAYFISSFTTSDDIGGKMWDDPVDFEMKGVFSYF
jgi:hypothetical protein